MSKHPLNEVILTYQFPQHEEDTWEYAALITEEDINEYFGGHINKDLFCYLDFERLVEDDESFKKWLTEKYYADAFEDFQRYYL